MACKDCIHQELCYKNCEESYDVDDMTCYYCHCVTCPEQNECKYFVDKSMFIKLPLPEPPKEEA